MARASQGDLRRRLAALVLLAAALAYVEASVVVYLREVIVPIRTAYYPGAVREALPLLTPAQLAEAGPNIARFLNLERARELAVIAVLLAMALGFRRRPGEGPAFFLIGFALWDVLYYLFLKITMGWPASLGTWDVLYLVPIPWVAPVWAPVVVSITFLIAGLVGLSRRRREVSAKGRALAALAALAGAGLVLVSFTLRVGEAVGGLPQQFDWAWFLAGWLLGGAALLWLMARPSRRRR